MEDFSSESETQVRWPYQGTDSWGDTAKMPVAEVEDLVAFAMHRLDNPTPDRVTTQGVKRSDEEALDRKFHDAQVRYVAATQVKPSKKKAPKWLKILAFILLLPVFVVLAVTAPIWGPLAIALFLVVSTVGGSIKRKRYWDPFQMNVGGRHV